MADTEELVIKIEDDEPKLPLEQKVEVKDGSKPESEPAVDPTADLQAQYEALQREQETRKADLDAARAREADARRQAEAARREATQSQTQVIDAQLEGITSGLSAAEAEAAGAEAEFASAMERADYAASAKAQRKISAAEARINQLSQMKDYLEGQKKAPPPQQRSNDVDGWIDSLTPASRDWMRAHREWAEDPAKRHRVALAHSHAVGEELTPDTPEYFAHIERRLGLRNEQPTERARDDQGRFVAQDNKPAATATQQRRPAPPSAPVSAGGNGSPALSSNVVTLTAGEARAATDGTIVWNYPDTSGQNRWKKGDPIGHQEMARRKREMQKQGLYDKTYTEQ